MEELSRIKKISSIINSRRRFIIYINFNVENFIACYHRVTDVCTRIDKKIDVLLCLLVYGIERLLFAQASNFVEIDRPIFTTLLQQTFG